MPISVSLAVCEDGGEPLTLEAHLRLAAAQETIALSKSIDLPNAEIEPYFAAARLHLLGAADVGIVGALDAVAAIDRLIGDISRTLDQNPHRDGHIDAVHISLLRSLRTVVVLPSALRHEERE